MVNNLNDGIAWGLFPLFFAAAGLSLHEISILGFIYPATWGICQLWTGMLSDQWGRKRLIVAGMMLQGAALLVLVSIAYGCSSSGHAPAVSSSDSSFAEMQHRGNMAMGVDQYASAHTFDITADGGRIELQSKGSDSLDVAQIRAHMRQIQHAFAAGDFAAPSFVHMREMPGTAVMARKKSLISYTYSDLPRGGEVRMSTADAEARAAIAEFMRAQRMEHHSAGTDER
ncbi:MAG: hypothetical protein Q7S20_04325 [Gemmatimonadaceae bacterium]|nr:hypothetical protein [Gemmatimonadaceae bacterium]